MTYLNLGSHVLLSLRISTVKWFEGSCGQNFVLAQLAQKPCNPSFQPHLAFIVNVLSIEIWQKLSPLAFQLALRSEGLGGAEINF